MSDPPPRPDDAPRHPAVLVTLLSGHKRDIDLTRRVIGHRRIVLLAHPGTEELARKVQQTEGEELAHVIELEEADALTQLRRIRRVLQGQRGSAGEKTRFVLNAAGGDPQLVLAMILLAYEEGHETWFIQEGRHERLPILKGVEIRNRIDGDEETVLRAVPPEGTPGSRLAQETVLPQDRVEAVLRALEKKDLVELYVHEAHLAARTTPTGRYLQEALLPP